MAAAYISWPFCAQKCTYCNFASGVFPRALEADYRMALAAEIEAHSWRWPPETLYLGGGTPSLMDRETLRRLLGAIPGRSWAEATIEAAPGSITRERARFWREAGINRVSIGAQSFVQAEIARSGRRHTAEIVAEEIALLRQEGLGNFNIDLIAGLPHQTAASWRESLDWIERLQPSHVSVYTLEVDQDSRLGSEILKGGARYDALAVPSEDLVVELYETAVERLGAMGIHRYEISNLARHGRQSRHNLKYWLLEPYAGFGADAHSFDGELRRQNVESPAEYVARFRAGESPCLASVPACRAEERFFVGLRLTRGLRPTPEEWTRYDEPIRRFVQDGLLASDGETLRLTNRGVLLSNEVFQEFINL